MRSFLLVCPFFPLSLLLLLLLGLIFNKWMRLWFVLWIFLTSVWRCIPTWNNGICTSKISSSFALLECTNCSSRYMYLSWTCVCVLFVLLDPGIQCHVESCTHTCTLKYFSALHLWDGLDFFEAWTGYMSSCFGSQGWILYSIEWLEAMEGHIGMMLMYVGPHEWKLPFQVHDRVSALNNFKERKTAACQWSLILSWKGPLVQLKKAIWLLLSVWARRNRCMTRISEHSSIPPALGRLRKKWRWWQDCFAPFGLVSCRSSSGRPLAGFQALFYCCPESHVT